MVSESPLWKPFTQMTDLSRARERPLVIARARGRWLIPSRGRRLYDGVSSLWANVHGHRIGAIDRAIRKQLSRVAHTTLLGPTHPPAEALARRLVRLAPSGLSRVFFSDNGSTAVEVAIKMAFQYHRQKPGPELRRTRFLSLAGAYHGDTLGAVGLGAIPLFHATYGPLVRRAIQLPVPATASRDEVRACLARLDAILDRGGGGGGGGERIAAFVFEPLVQGAAGIRIHPATFLREAAARCRRRGILLVADEVATGFGRTGQGKMFACQEAGIRPDLLCLAKGITGGYLPLSATLATERIYRAFLGRFDAFRAFFHGHTYGGNPLACAAALANLDLLEKNRIVEKVARKSACFARSLKALRRHPCVKEVRQKGFMAGIELARPGGRPFPVAARVGYRVSLACRTRGLLIRALGDVVVLLPPLTATEAELAWMARVVASAIEEVVKA